MRRWGVAIALVCVPVSAQAMTVTEFLGKAEGLKRKGMLALMSSDLGLLKTEMKTIGTAYRADLLAARAAGKPPHSCPPPKGSAAAKFNAGELMADLQKIPAAQARVTPMKTAFYAFMKRKFPCPA